MMDDGCFEAAPALYWSEFNKGYMKKPHIERFLTHDIYISPLEMVSANQNEDRGRIVLATPPCARCSSAQRVQHTDALSFNGSL